MNWQSALSYWTLKISDRPFDISSALRKSIGISPCKSPSLWEARVTSAITTCCRQLIYYLSQILVFHLHQQIWHLWKTTDLHAFRKCSGNTKVRDIIIKDETLRKGHAPSQGVWPVEVSSHSYIPWSRWYSESHQHPLSRTNV